LTPGTPNAWQPWRTTSPFALANAVPVAKLIAWFGLDELASYDVAETGSRTVSHDAAGRMVTDGVRTYTWDAFSSLVAVKTSGALTEALQ
jgi:YD repeat-containing protein